MIIVHRAATEVDFASPSQAKAKPRNLYHRIPFLQALAQPMIGLQWLALGTIRFHEADSEVIKYTHAQKLACLNYAFIKCNHSGWNFQLATSCIKGNAILKAKCLPSWITQSGGKPVSHEKLRAVVFLKAFQQWGKQQSKCISRGGYSHLPTTLF